MENTKASVELTLQEWNAVLHALSRQPFADVVNLIGNVRKQVEEQIKQESHNGN